MVGLGDTLGEDTGVFTVEEKVDPGQFGVLALLLRVPIARVNFARAVVALNNNGAPVAWAIRVLAKTLARDWVEISILIVTKRDPLLREAAIVLCVIKRLEREPVSWWSGGGLVVDTLKALQIKAKFKRCLNFRKFPLQVRLAIPQSQERRKASSDDQSRPFVVVCQGWAWKAPWPKLNG